ncbi:hypothetical protein MCUN1_001908 [Malassezia cuniculi]|uniref:SEC7 domain-containing protein n=1 Tax=Malassezia cuniculi TaxID=948313 RepID=A0AAF0EU40_9BASI|nr:hypothetical protein MCUN1_001908 [Malassezia cuniculi]
MDDNPSKISAPPRETRTNAIAMLRRAASNREISRTPTQPPPAPPRSAARPAPSRAVTPQEPSALERKAATRPESPAVHPASNTPPHAALTLDRPRLPTLDQLRRRILQERATTGLSRSASTGAASQVARAYAMQKLLGATNPVPEADLLSVVRGVNAARAHDMEVAEDPSSEKRHSRTLEVADQALYVSNAQAHSPDIGADKATRKRATLMRSVSARDVARLHMMRRLERRREGERTDEKNTTLAKRTAEGGALGLTLSDAGSTSASPALPTSQAAGYSDDSGSASFDEPQAVATSPGVAGVAAAGAMDHVAFANSLNIQQPAPFVSDTFAAQPVRSPLTPYIHVPPVQQEYPKQYALSVPDSPALHEQPCTPTLSVNPAPDPAPSYVAKAPTTRQKPLPRLPSATLTVPETGSSFPSPTLMQSDFDAARVNTPISSEACATDAASYYRSLRSSRSREEAREDYSQESHAREESRGARIFGSLRRKTSKKGLAHEVRSHSRSQSVWETMRSRSRHGAQASDVSGMQRVIVTLLGDRSGLAGTAIRHIELPITAATLVRWNRSLSEPFRDVLSYFPAEISHRLALEPPRRLQRATPVLLAVDDAYVKLRFAFVFDDVLLLLKTLPVGDSSTDAAGHVMKRLASVPDLHEQFIPVDVVDLQRAEIHGLPPVEPPVDGDMRRCMQPFVSQFAAMPHEALDAAAANTRGVRLPRPTLVAHLIYATPSLDRDTVAKVLFDPTQRAILEAYVATFRFSGLPVIAALRLVLLDARFPLDMSTFEVLLLAFAAHWLRENRGSQTGTGFSLELVTDLTFAIMALNDALHSGEPFSTPSLFSRRNSLMTPEVFVANFRENDPGHVVSDQKLYELYYSIQKYPLMCARRHGIRARTIYIDRATLPLSLVPGVASGPISVSLDTPDAELRLELYGDDLHFDPPVLSFASSPTAVFRVTSTGPGTRRMSFVRLGFSAPIYTGDQSRIAPLPGSRAPACWVPLMRDVPLTLSTRPTRPSLSLVHHTLRQGSLRYTLNLPDAAAMTSLVALLLDNQQRHAATLERMPARERVARTLAVRVLQTALLGETALEDTGEHGAGRHGHATVARLASAMPATTGLELVRIARENSLLYSILLDSD